MKRNERQYLGYFNERADRVMKKISKLYPELCSSEAKADMAKALTGRLALQAGPFLESVYENCLAKNDLLEAFRSGEESRKAEWERIDLRFAETLRAGGNELLKKLSPRLFEMVETTEKNFQKMATELLDRFEKNRDSLETELFNGNAVHSIIKMQFDLGDSHNKGCATVILTTDAGKIVYKPHDVAIDCFMRRMVERFFSDVTRIPKTLEGNHYGFCEYIENKPASGMEEADEYYRKFGGLCAIFRMLQSEDLHYENFLCDGVYPVPIDLETVISPELVQNRLPAAAFGELMKSLYYSCLFPQIRQGEADISPLFSTCNKNRSIPLVDGKMSPVTEHRDPFNQGFQLIYQRILKEKEQLKKYMEELEQIRIRIVLRSTAGYTKLLQKTWMANWVLKPELKCEIRKTLARKYLKAGKCRYLKLSRKEAESIYAGDVPYFSTLGGSRDLYAGDEMIAGGFFSKSCLEVIRESINDMSEENLGFMLALFELAMNRVLHPGNKDCKSGSSFNTGGKIEIENLHARCIHQAEKICCRIMEEVLEGPDGSKILFSVNHSATTAFNAMGMDLSEGITGTVLFLIAVSAVSTNEALCQKAAELAHQLIRQLESHLDEFENDKKLPETVCSPAYYGGLSGMLFAFSAMLRILSHHREKQTDSISENDCEIMSDICRLQRKTFQLLTKIDFRTVSADPVNGLAGVVSILCDLDMEGIDPKRKRMVRKLADRILLMKETDDQGVSGWKADFETRFLSGMGHGQCGIASALERAGILLKKDEYLKAADAAYRFEDRIYDSKLGGWPDLRKISEKNRQMHGYCSGAPGIGLDMTGKNDRRSKRNLKRALDNVIRTDLLSRDHLCCGNCAMAEFLIEAGTVLKREDLTERAGMILNAMMKRADHNAGYAIFNNSDDDAGKCMPSFYFGCAGIGYELLRMTDPEMIPCPFVK